MKVAGADRKPYLHGYGECLQDVAPLLQDMLQALQGIRFQHRGDALRAAALADRIHAFLDGKILEVAGYYRREKTK